MRFQFYSSTLHPIITNFLSNVKRLQLAVSAKIPLFLRIFSVLTPLNCINHATASSKMFPCENPRRSSASYITLITMGGV